MQRQLLEARLHFAKILKVIVDEWNQDFDNIAEVSQERMDIWLVQLFAVQQVQSFFFFLILELFD